MRGQQGQGTIEYAAVVLVVAAVFAAAIALLTGTGLGERVMDAFRRALCVVTGGNCAVALTEPCVRLSEEHRDGGHLSITVVRVGHRSAELREHLADGTVRVTLVSEGSGGLELRAGAGAHLRWGSHSFAAGTELRAAVLAGQASGRTWMARDDAEADRIVAEVALADRSRRPVHTVAGSPDMAPLPIEVHAPEPAVTFSERTGSLELDLQRRGRVAATLSRDEAYGERVDHATGRRTVYVRNTDSARGRVSFGPGASAEGAAESDERYAITYDRDGRPLDFAVLSTLDVDGAVGLPAPFAPIAGWLDVSGAGARHVETEQHLDLAVPENAAAAQAFLAPGASQLGLRLTADLLRERLDRDGTLSVRSYATEETAHEVGADGAVFGGEVGSQDASARLTGAVRRGPAGAWERDPACGEV